MCFSITAIYKKVFRKYMFFDKIKKDRFICKTIFKLHLKIFNWWAQCVSYCILEHNGLYLKLEQSTNPACMYTFKKNYSSKVFVMSCLWGVMHDKIEKTCSHSDHQSLVSSCIFDHLNWLKS